LTFSRGKAVALDRSGGMKQSFEDA